MQGKGAQREKAEATWVTSWGNPTLALRHAPTPPLLPSLPPKLSLYHSPDWWGTEPQGWAEVRHPPGASAGSFPGWLLWWRLSRDEGAAGLKHSPKGQLGQGPAAASPGGRAPGQAASACGPHLQSQGRPGHGRALLFPPSAGTCWCRGQGRAAGPAAWEPPFLGSVHWLAQSLPGLCWIPTTP